MRSCRLPVLHVVWSGTFSTQIFASTLHQPFGFVSTQFFVVHYLDGSRSPSMVSHALEIALGRVGRIPECLRVNLFTFKLTLFQLLWWMHGCPRGVCVLCTATWSLCTLYSHVGLVYSVPPRGACVLCTATWSLCTFALMATSNLNRLLLLLLVLFGWGGLWGVKVADTTLSKIISRYILQLTQKFDDQQGEHRHVNESSYL